MIFNPSYLFWATTFILGRGKNSLLGPKILARRTKRGRILPEKPRGSPLENLCGVILCVKLRAFVTRGNHFFLRIFFHPGKFGFFSQEGGFFWGATTQFLGDFPLWFTILGFSGFHTRDS